MVYKTAVWGLEWAFFLSCFFGGGKGWWCLREFYKKGGGVFLTRGVFLYIVA